MRACVRRPPRQYVCVRCAQAGTPKAVLWSPLQVCVSYPTTALRTRHLVLLTCAPQSSLHSIIVDENCACLIATSESSAFVSSWRLDVRGRMRAAAAARAPSGCLSRLEALVSVCVCVSVCLCVCVVFDALLSPRALPVDPGRAKGRRWRVGSAGQETVEPVRCHRALLLLLLLCEWW